jgi:hypothetical protein
MQQAGRTPSQGYCNRHTGSFGQHDGRAKGIRMWLSRAIVISLAANLSVREETRKAEKASGGGDNAKAGAALTRPGFAQSGYCC